MEPSWLSHRRNNSILLIRSFPDGRSRFNHFLSFSLYRLVILNAGKGEIGHFKCWQRGPRFRWSIIAQNTVNYSTLSLAGQWNTVNYSTLSLAGRWNTVNYSTLGLAGLWNMQHFKLGRAMKHCNLQHFKVCRALKHCKLQHFNYGAIRITKIIKRRANKF